MKCLTVMGCLSLVYGKGLHKKDVNKVKKNQTYMQSLEQKHLTPNVSGPISLLTSHESTNSSVPHFFFSCSK